MPPKRRSAYEDEDMLAEPSQALNLNKRARAEEPGPGIVGTNTLSIANKNSDIFDTEKTVRRSSRRGRGSGGQLAQVKNLERLQTATVYQSKRLNDLDTATKGCEINPMAPSQPPPRVPASKPRPKPRLKTKTGGSVSVSGAPLSATTQPSFSLASPGGQFGFRLPEVRSQRDLDSSSTSSSVPRSSREASIFSAHSHVSTVPTSRANSVCPSSQGDQDAIQSAHGHSSYLKRLAHASQSGVEAPRCLSRVTEGVMDQLAEVPHLTQQSLQPEFQKDQGQSFTSSFSVREPGIPPSRSTDLDDPTASPRLVSFYRAPLDRPDPTGYTQFATPSEDEDHVGQDDNNLQIDETTPSEDDRFAESVLRGENPHSHPYGRQSVSYQANYNDILMGDTTPADEQRSESFFGRKDAYVRGQCNPGDLSDAERAGEVVLRNNGHPNDYAEDVASTRREQMHRRSEARNPSGPIDQGPTNDYVEAVPPCQSAQGSSNSHVEDALVRQHRTHRRSGGHASFDLARTSHVPSYNDQGSANGQAEDVVLAHRRRNGAPRLPSNSHLASIRDQQYSEPQNTTRPRSTSSRSSRPSNEEHRITRPSTSPQPLRIVNPPVTPVGPATAGAEPWQIQFYKPAVQDILERAKQFSHCDAASVDAFPLRGHFNSLAVEYVEEAIRERRSRGLPASDGWWPHYTSEICRLLWEDLGNWRSALRKKARVYVTQRYKWDPENRRQENSVIAKGLLGGHGAFLKNGVDKNGHTNNLAHPALAGLIIDFFYTGPSSLGITFPEVFGAEVPRVTVAIAATALKVVLDEMVSSQAEVNFRVSTYTPVYLEMLGLMKKCDTSVVHADKTKALRIQWAHQGNNCVAERETVATTSTGFDVTLD